MEVGDAIWYDGWVPRLVTQGDLETRILELIDADGENVHRVAKAAEDEARADVAYKIAFSQAILRASGRNREVREAEALLACQDQFLQKRITTAVLMAARESRDHNRLEMDGLRTLAANLREVVKPF